MFLDIAVHLARPDGGVVAFLTPPSFLAGQYFRNLRRLLREHACPASIDLVESRADVFRRRAAGGRTFGVQTGRHVQPAECALVDLLPTGIRIEQTGPLFLPVGPYGPWTLVRSAGRFGTCGTAARHAYAARGFGLRGLHRSPGVEPPQVATA